MSGRTVYRVGQQITLDLQDGLGPLTGTIRYVGNHFHAWRGVDVTILEVLDDVEEPIRLTLDEADRYRVTK
jgi:hypothetical protein